VRQTAICLAGFTLSRLSSICTLALPLALSVLGTAINTQPWAWCACPHAIPFLTCMGSLLINDIQWFVGNW
jgi:uncharacterized membrane protein YkgB